MNYSEWYKNHYHELCGGGVWLRGGELNTLTQEEFGKRDFKVLFARLSSYFDTRESFTHQYLYQIAASIPGIAPDVAYLPLRQDAQIFANSNVPWMIGTQSKNGAEEFDLIGISNSIILEVLNVPAFLKTSGIPLRKSERMERTDLPLIILGGANALYSSVLWGKDPLVDGVFVGESGTAIKRILEICRDSKKEGLSRRETLARLRSVDGFFEPENPVINSKGRDVELDAIIPFTNGMVSYMEENAGSGNLQISEGCPCFCNFCSEAWDRKPYRERSPGELLKQAMVMKAEMGLEEINIFSFNFNLHSGIYQIIWDLLPLFRRIGLKSQRFDLLAHDPDMIELLKVTQKTSVTCGLEGISRRIRSYLHKNLAEGDLERAVEAIFKNRLRELKLFLIATGLEKDEDYDEFRSFLKKLKTLTGQAQVRIIVSCTPLVRFPWTPLEFAEAQAPEVYFDVIEKIQSLTGAAGFEFRESAEVSEYLISQIIVRAADERVQTAMLDALDASGFIYHRVMTQSFLTSFSAAMNGQGLSEELLLKGHTLDESYSKPWGRLETGVKREFLWKKYEEALQFKETEYCLGREWAKASCLGCGACPDGESITRLVKASQKKPYGIQKFNERAVECRANPGSASFLVNFAEKTEGLPRPILGSALARAVMKAFPDMTKGYRGYKDSYWGREERDMWVYGLDAMSLYFDTAEIMQLQQHCASPDAFKKISSELGSFGSVSGFAPADFLPTRLVFISPFDFRPDKYLQGRGLKFTMRRSPDGSASYEMSKDSVKKGIIKTLTVFSFPVGGWRVELAPGSKFRVHEFKQNCFATRGRNDWLRISCRSE